VGTGGGEAIWVHRRGEAHRRGASRPVWRRDFIAKGQTAAGRPHEEGRGLTPEENQPPRPPKSALRLSRSLRPGRLDAEERCVAGRRTLRLVGAVDVASAAEVESLVASLAVDAEEVVMDLSEVSFLDTAGLRTMVSCQRRCRAAGCAFRVISRSVAVERVLEITKLTDVPPFAAE
jgi:anti-anti-sigma factor